MMEIDQKHKRYLNLDIKVSQLRKSWNIYRSLYLIKGQKGQALLESLISFSVFFIFVFGIFYFSLLYHTKLWLHHTSYESAVCSYYESKQSYKCLMQAKKFIAHAFPYLKNIKINFQSGLNYKESIIQVDFPFYTQIIARQSFYAKY